MKKTFWFLGIVSAIVVSSLFQGCASLPPSPPGTKPAITNAFINREKGNYGDVLKIYLEAEDPKGYMFKIFSVVDQPGYGQYFPNINYVEAKDQHHLLGYLQWNTFSPNAPTLPEFSRITIKVSIADTDGNESNTVFFPFEFVSEAVPESPLPPPFNQGNIPRLGYISINLYNPYDMGGPEGGFFREHRF